MLVLSRKAGEAIIIGDDIMVTFLGFHRGTAKIGVHAPDEVEIDREEIRERKLKESGGRTI